MNLCVAIGAVPPVKHFNKIIPMVKLNLSAPGVSGGTMQSLLFGVRIHNAWIDGEWLLSSGGN